MNAPLPVSPLPTPALESRNAIARAHAGWSAALAAGDRAAALEHFARTHNLTAADATALSQLRNMRLWAIDTTLRHGDPEGAAQELSAFEALNGPTPQSRLLKARLHYFRGEFADAAIACADAIVLLPPAKSPSKQFSQIVRLRSECLCLDGRHDEARRLLERAFAHKAVWTTEDIRALRQTVVDEPGLGDFHAFLADYFSYPGIRSRVALYHYSMACRDLGLYDQAELAIRQRFLSATKLEKFGARPPSTAPKPDWVEDARQTLRDLKAVTASADAEMFLISGTLLGAVREGDILGHDKDIDVGIMESPALDKERVETAFRRSGKFSVKPYQVPSLLRVQHASGVMVDVFWHREEGGLIIHEGMKSKWWNAPFDLVDFAFLGDTHRIPGTFGRYLGENYGEWETPNAEFETFVDTPNMVTTSEGEIVWYLYCKLFDYYLQGRVPQFRKVSEAIARLRPDDHATHAIVRRVLAVEAALGSGPVEDALDEIAFDPLEIPSSAALDDEDEASAVAEAAEADAREEEGADRDA